MATSLETNAVVVTRVHCTYIAHNPLTLLINLKAYYTTTQLVNGYITEWNTGIFLIFQDNMFSLLNLKLALCTTCVSQRTESHQENIRIHHECPCRIRKSHPRGRTSNQGWGLLSLWLNSYPEGEISLSCMDWLKTDSFSPTFKWIVPRTCVVMWDRSFSNGLKAYLI